MMTHDIFLIKPMRCTFLVILLNHRPHLPQRPGESSSLLERYRMIRHSM